MNEIYPTNDVADSNAGVNGNDSDGSNSDNKDNNSFDSKGEDYGKPNNGDTDDSADSNKGQHSNVSDMAIHAEDSGIDDWSVPDSHTTDAYSVDLVYSD